jgi:nucleotide-binding universal stress UspA family protein
VQQVDKILCPTDFSANAHGALLQALDLAQRHDASVDLVHVANAPHYVRRDMVGFLGERGARPLNEIALEAAEGRVKKLLSELDESQRSRITPYTRFGDPAETLVHFAAAHHADLIVLGASGLPRLSKYVLGGVANKVLRRAERPVLCVPSDQAKPFEKVVVATDFSDCAASALDAAFRLSSVHGAELNVIHVTPSAWTLPPDLNVGLPGDNQNWLELLRSEAAEQLEKFVEEARSRGVSVDGTVLETGSPAHAVLDYAERNNCDLIALGTHGRSGVTRMMLGSVAEAVVHHATVPVLTVHKPE